MNFKKLSELGWKRPEDEGNEYIENYKRISKKYIQKMRELLFANYTK
jgi:hypothetical protein